MLGPKASFILDYLTTASDTGWMGSIFSILGTHGHFKIPTLEKKQPEASGLVARTADKGSGSGTGLLCP